MQNTYKYLKSTRCTNRQQRRMLYWHMREALVDAASPMWRGRKARLKYFAKQFVKRYQRNETYLHRTLSSPTKLAGLALIMLNMYAMSVDADPKFPEIINPFNLADVGTRSTPVSVDIDGDGDLDLFVGNYSGNVIYFENTGSSSSAAFASSSSNPFGLTNVGNNASPEFVDIDGDGDLDAFVGNNASGNVIYFENTGSSSSAAFATSSANPFGLAVGVNRPTPDFVDIDGDGDLDAFVGQFSGNVIYFENTGTSTSAAFASSVSNPFGLVNIGANNRSVPKFVDIDGDNDLDAFVGDNGGNTRYFENTGTSTSAAFASSSSNPFGLFNVGSQANPEFVDIDGDGLLDVLIGNADGNIYYFENTGSSSSAAFRGGNPFGLVDVGNTSSPDFVDINGDGDLDAFVGESGGNVIYFENTGTSTSAAFAASSTNPFNLANVGNTSSPDFVDIDGDDDLDAFVGESIGNVIYFENTGTSTSAAFASSSSNPFNLADVGSNSSPDFVDIDGDGDLDAFVGESTGNVIYFENTGTSTSAAFAASSTNPFNLADVGSNASPKFVDINGDGDLDAFVGESTGNVIYFENTGNSTSAAFASSSSNPFNLLDVGFTPSPDFVDINGDGDLDAFVGKNDGNVILFENLSPNITTFSPADNATNVSPSSNLTLTFSEAVTAKSGNVTIKKTSDNSTAETMSVTGGAISGSGSSTITINPTSDLAFGTGYYVQVDATAFDNSSSVSVRGVAPKTTWNFTTLSLDSDGSLAASSTISEPVALPTTATATSSAVNVFDFTLSDGGAADGQALTISQIVLHTSGDGDFSKVTWRLNGPDVSNVTGTYNSGANTITFSSLSISIANSGSETYTVNAYYNNNTGLTEGQAFILSVDGDTDLTVGSSGTQMATTTAVTNGTGSTVDVTATKLVFTTQPSPLTGTSGVAIDFTTDPVVTAQDAAGNTDKGFTSAVTLAETGSGTATYTNNSVSAVSGVATFTGLTTTYTATADGETFGLRASSGSLTTGTSSNITSDVVATKLAFTTQPSPLSGTSGSAIDFTTDPVVTAQDANGTTDTGFTSTVTLAETGSGSATYTNNSVNAVSGVATFTGLTTTYTATADGEIFGLEASGGSLTTATSSNIASDVVATKLAFTTQPSPLSGTSGSAIDFATDPVVTAQDANGTTDTGFTSTVTLAETGSGSATYTNNSVSAVSGVATFTGLTTTYTATADGEIFGLEASGGSLTTATSSNITSDVVATKLVFTTQPSPLSGTSGSAIDFTTDPVVTAQDANGTTDTGFTSTVTLAETGSGSATYTNNSVSAVAGVATFTGLTTTYTATADGETFGLEASGGSLTTGTSSNITSDVVATKLVFTTQPAPLSGNNLTALDFTTDPVVTAQDANNTTDTGFTDTVTLTETGAGTATYTNNSVAAVSGVATFTGLTMTYTAAGTSAESVALQADDTSSGNEGDITSLPTSSTITIIVNRAAVTSASTVTTTEDTDLAIALTGTDADNDALTAIISTLPAKGTLYQTSDGSTRGSQITSVPMTVTDGSRRVIYAPVANENGTTYTTFGFKLNDGTVDSDEGLMTIDVTAVNDVPTLSAVSDVTVLEDASAQTVNLTGIGTGQSNESQTLSVTATSSNTALIPNPTVSYTSANTTGSLSFTPIAHQNGSATITVTVTDDGGTSNSGANTVSQTFNIVVGAVNDVPTLSPIASVTIAEDAAEQRVALSGISNGNANESQEVRVSATTSNAALISNLAVHYNHPNPTGWITFTPGLNQNGSATVTVEVDDGGGNANGGTSQISQTFTVTVTPTADAPVASDDAFTIVEDTPTALNVLQNDTDIDGDALTLTGVSNATNGTAVAQSDGTVLFTPTAHFVGDGSFSYAIADPTGQTSTASATVTVTNTNDVPVAVDDVVILDFGVEKTNIDVRANDTDIDGDALSVSIASEPANGTVIVNSNQTIHYRPNSGFFGEDRIGYTIDDGNGGMASATAIVSIENPGEPPVPVDDVASTQQDQAVIVDVLANDTDAENDPLTLTEATSPSHGAVAIGDGGVTYTPNTGFHGTDSFTYVVSDGKTTGTGAVTITVIRNNTAPVAVADEVVTLRGEAVVVSVLANDTDSESDVLSVTGVNDAGNGSVVLNDNGTVTYTPNTGFSGNDTFTYVINDGFGGSATGTVTVVVNSAPIANADEATTQLNQAIAIDVLANDQDAESHALRIVETSNPGNGVITLGDGTLTYAPNEGFVGEDVFTYTVADAFDARAIGNVTVTIVQPDVAPPVISVGPTITSSSDQDVLAFETDELATAVIHYGVASDALSSSLRVTDMATSFSATLPGLDSQTDYFYQITLTDVFGNAGQSEIFAFTTPDRAAPVIANVQVIAVNETNATVTWDTDEPAVAFVIYGQGALGDGSPRSAQTTEPSSAHSHTITGLAALTDYQFVVVSTDPSGNEARSDVASFTTPDQTAPVMTASPAITDLNVDRLTVQWETDETSTTEVVLTHQGTGAEIQGIDEKLVTAHETVMSGLEADTPYGVVVISRDVHGNVRQVDMGRVRTLVAPDTTPAQILGVPAISDVTDNRATIAWQTNEPASGFVILSTSQDLSNSLTFGSATPAQQHRVELTGLIPSQDYFLQVSSQDVAGNPPTIGPDIPLTFRTQAAPDVTAPVILEGPIDVGVSQATAQVIWKMDEAANGRVRFATSADALRDEMSVFESNFNQDQSITLTGLLAGTIYFYQVLSSDPAGNGPTISEVKTFTTENVPDTTPPVITSGPSAVDVTPRGALIVWTTDEPSTSEIDVNGRRFGRSEAVREHRVQVTDLTPATRILYTVISTDVSGNTLVREDRLGFRTLDPNALEPPSILEGPWVQYVTNVNAVIGWVTNKPTTAEVVFGDAATFASEPRKQISQELKREHSFTLSKLNPSSNYLYRVLATDASGNQVVAGSLVGFTPKPGVATKFAAPGEEGGFATAALPDTRVPIILRGPNVVAATSTTLTIEWGTDENSDSHVDFGEGGMDRRVENGVDVQTHRVVLTNLTAGTTYQYRVSSTDPSDNGPVQSDIFLATTEAAPDVTPPRFEGPPQVLKVTDRTAVIGWQTNERSVTFVSYGVGGLDNQAASPDYVTQHQITLTNLTPDTQYQFRSQAVDQIGNGPTQSELLSFRTEQTPDLVAPMILPDPRAAVVTENYAVIRWQTDELSDSVVRFGIGGTDQIIGSARDVMDHEMVINNLNADTEYQFVVESTDRSGNGPAIWTVQTFRTPAAIDTVGPAAPLNLTARSGLGKTLVSWDAVTDADVIGYRVLRADAGGDFVAVATLTELPEYVDDGLEAGISYRYRVHAVDQALNLSDVSQEVIVVPNGADIVAAPVSLGNAGVDQVVVLTVEDVASPTSLTYNFQIANDEGFTDIISSASGVSPGTDTEIVGATGWRVDVPLEDGQTYWWRAWAFDGTFDGVFLPPQSIFIGGFPGDLNRDLAVNVEDFLIFAEQVSLGIDVTQNPELDVDKTRVLDDADFDAFVGLFGTTYGDVMPTPILANHQLSVQLIGAIDHPSIDRELEVAVVLGEPTGAFAFGVELSYNTQFLQFVGAEPGEMTVSPFGVLQAADGQIWVGGQASGGELVMLRFAYKSGAQFGSRQLVTIKDALIRPQHGESIRLTRVDNVVSIPGVFRFFAAYPNPFNPSVILPYAVPKVADVKIVVYNIQGQQVATVVDGTAVPGFYEAIWNGRDDFGRNVASGVYFMRMEARGFEAVRKVMLLK